MSPRPWKLSPEDKDAIRTAYAAGQHVRDLAEQYSVSTASIYNVLAADKPRRVQPPRTRVPAVAEEERPYRDSTHGYVPLPCGDDQCGQPQTGPGHPRRGWVQIKRAGENVARWFCSFHCVSRYAIHRELAGGDSA